MVINQRQNTVNREHWLTEVARQIEPVFNGYVVHKYRVTCGWPTRGGIGGKRTVIGQCHPSISSKGGFFELFISPLLEEPIKVAGVLCHEMAHIVAGCEAGHAKDFIKVCKHAGIVKGKPTQVMPGDKLNERLSKILDRQGPYPHTAIVPVMKKVVRELTTVGLWCECGCRCTMSVKWLNEVGLPTCACGGDFMVNVRGGD